MANAFRSILGATGGVQPTGNAQPADVLAGKTFSNAEGIDKTGTMVNNGAVSETLAGGESYTIPEGYHNGNGTVTATESARTYTKLGSIPQTLAADYAELVISAFNDTGSCIINYSGTGTIALNESYNRGAAVSNLLIINGAKSGDTISVTGGSGIIIHSN